MGKGYFIPKFSFVTLIVMKLLNDIFNIFALVCFKNNDILKAVLKTQ